MPYKNKAYGLFRKRAYNRTRRHGNWRQTVIDCGMMCIYPVDDLPCGEIANLQFHETFGESSDGRMQLRVLLCATHHDVIHDSTYNLEPTNSYRISIVCEDIEREQYLYGGTEGWARYYNVDLTRFGVFWKLPETQGRLGELL